MAVFWLIIIKTNGRLQSHYVGSIAHSCQTAMSNAVKCYSGLKFWSALQISQVNYSFFSMSSTALFFPYWLSSSYVLLDSVCFSMHSGIKLVCLICSFLYYWVFISISISSLYLLPFFSWHKRLQQRLIQKCHFLASSVTLWQLHLLQLCKITSVSRKILWAHFSDNMAGLH